ncbi:UPF0481 protein [Actinidia chinensis var. chinensis]|uniref:UPF0481 protein n=1 Tax=Actinidia chinensis var. chinensis TaxID=1590841 RepID=A0A2R6RXA5_ACTCC|nr:UPF0481 protein [Actinidia chinensis var. chinensis]
MQDEIGLPFTMRRRYILFFFDLMTWQIPSPWMKLLLICRASIKRSGRCPQDPSESYGGPEPLVFVLLSNSTEPFLRNLIAFEQCFPGVSCYFTSYAFLMDMLVNSVKDIEVLQKAGIIENYLGADQDASDLFNNLCKEVLVAEFFFTDTFNQATEYSKRCWSATVAHVRRKYFATPWTFIAFCVSLIAFGTNFLHATVMFSMMI